jgi:hypothetical protein
MKFSTFADRSLRVIAVLAAIGFMFVVVIVGIMANDAGNAAGARAGKLIFSLGFLLALWVLICSILPRLVTVWLPWPVLRFVLVKLPSYVFGLAGLAWCLSWGYGTYRVATRANPNVKPGDSEQPMPNPHPTHSFEAAGTLPAAIPVEDFLAVYATDFSPTAKVSGPCQRLDDLGPKEFWRTLPLLKEESVPLARADGRYRATFVVDRYLPGQCNWHLKEVRYRLHASGYGYVDSNFGVGKIKVFDELHPPSDLPKWETIYRGRVDVWCLEGRNKNVTPYYPEICGDWSTYNFRASPSLRANTPPEATESHAVVMALPDTASIELNFHDLDVLAPREAPRP